jgi:hypothetical protein
MLVYISNARLMRSRRQLHSVVIRNARIGPKQARNIAFYLGCSPASSLSLRMKSLAGA